jgi:hypothetical protein
MRETRMERDASHFRTGQSLQQFAPGPFEPDILKRCTGCSAKKNLELALQRSRRYPGNGRKISDAPFPPQIRTHGRKRASYAARVHHSADRPR